MVRVLGGGGASVAEGPVPARGRTAGRVGEGHAQRVVAGRGRSAEGRRRGHRAGVADGGVGVDQAVAAVAVPAGARFHVHHVGRGARERVPDLLVGVGRVRGDHQRRHARRVGRRATGAVEGQGVVAALVAGAAADVGGGQDGRGDQVHGVGRVLVVGAVAGAPPALAVAGVVVGVGVHAGIGVEGAGGGPLAAAAGRGRADRHHVGVVGRVAHVGEVVVARGGEQDATRVPGVLQGGVGGGVAGDVGADAHADDVGAVVGGPVQGVLDVAEVHRTGVVGDLAGHDRGSAGDAGHADAVVGDGGGHAGAGGAVARAAAVVVGIAVAAAEVVAGHQVQVGVVDVHAAVQDGDDHARGSVALALVPGRLGLGVEADRADGGPRVGVRAPVVGDHLADVVVAPLAVVVRVVGDGGGEGAPVRRGRGDLARPGEGLGQRLHVAASAWTMNQRSAPLAAARAAFRPM